MVVQNILARRKDLMDRKEVIENLSEAELKDLFYAINRLRKYLDDSFLEKFSRALPFAEVLFDRWERARFLGCGEGASVYDSSCFFGTVSVGKNTWVGPYTILDGSGGLEIGDNCSISAGVQIYSHDSVQWAVSGGLQQYEYASTKIGNNCYIGPNTIIAKGVTIGDGCVVGANSFVNKSFASGSKLGGSPARIL
jgi:acetyltransferase-like isoleucine patch superfamily enzyme